MGALKSIARILNSDRLHSDKVKSILAALVFGMFVTAIAISGWAWLAWLVVASITAIPFAFRWSLDRLAERHREHSSAHWDQGRAHLREGDYGLAIAEFSTAIGANRNCMEAYVIRGDAYQLIGEYDLAIADYTTALEIDPRVSGVAFRGLGLTERNRVMTYNCRGRSNYAKGKYDLAIADFTLAIGIRDSQPERKVDSFNAQTGRFIADSFDGRGQAYLATGKYDLAIADFSDAISIFNVKLESYNHRGLAYHAKGEWELAIADFDVAIERLSILTSDPKDHSQEALYNDRGVANLKAGNHELAINDLEIANRVNPDYLQAKLNLEKAYAYNNRRRAYEAKKGCHV